MTDRDTESACLGLSVRPYRSFFLRSLYRFRGSVDGPARMHDLSASIAYAPQMK
jgi:hypothetical protein